MTTSPERAKNYHGYIALTRELFELYPDEVLLARERRRIANWGRFHPYDSQEPAEKHLSRWHYGGVRARRREKLDGLSNDLTLIYPLVEMLDSALGRIDHRRAMALRLRFRLDDEQTPGLMSSKDVLARLRADGLTTGTSPATVSLLTVGGIKRLIRREPQMNQIADFLDQ